MTVRRACSFGLACAVLGYASLSAADPEEEADPLPPVIVAIDFDAIPMGALPAMPREADVPPSVSKEKRATGVRIEKVKNPFGRKKLPKELLAQIGRTELVDMMPNRPEIAAMYTPAPDGTSFEGESMSRMACRRKEPLSPVRWETLTLLSGGKAKIEIKDLWYDSESCTVELGSTSELVFKAIAWDGVRPWLFALRDEKSVTFLMPRATEIGADAMAGGPITVQGGFTRVTLPIGRWGSSSFVANLAGLEFKPPAPPAKPSPKGQAAEVPAASESDAPLIEVAVELVQTMSERSPTLLVRRNRPEEDRAAPVTSNDPVP